MQPVELLAPEHPTFPHNLGRGTQEFLLSQRDVRAAASFMNLVFHFLGFCFRTSRGKLSVTFYPKALWVFFQLPFL